MNKKDNNGGYLGTRIEVIENLVRTNHDIVWLNQYANENNVAAHYNTTAKEILKEFDKIDYLFVGVGTSGTIMGCSKAFRKYSKNTKIIADDVEGSVTFGGKSKKRHIPGLGTSRRPSITDESYIDDIVMVGELDTVETCHFVFYKYALLLGGSSGSVLYAIKKYKDKIPSSSKIVAISPDFGHKYLDTIYNARWVENKFNLTRIAV